MNIITGTNGFIGSNLREKLPMESVISLSRSKDIDNQNNSIYYDMNKDLDVIIDKELKIESVFHLAHDFKDKHVNENNINVIGIKNLIKFCKKRKLKLIYISSIMALPARSNYGKIKLKCEELVREYENSIIIRPAVVTDKAGGIFKTLNNIFRFSPIFFIPGSGKYNMYSINIENLTEFIIKTKSIKTNEIIYAYDNGPVDFIDLLEIKNKIIISIPIKVLKILLLIPKLFGIHLKSISNDGLNTLLEMPKIDFKHKNYKDF